MILGTPDIKLEKVSVPRVGGGDPVRRLRYKKVFQCSPRRRG